MSHDRFQRLAALAGVAAGGLLVAGLVITRESPSGDAPSTAELAAYLHAHGTAEAVNAIAIVPLVAFCLLFFTAALRGALRSREAGEATYSAVVGAAAPLVVIALLLMAAGSLATYSAADQGEPELARTIYMTTHFSWLAWAAPTAALLVATGIGGLRTAALNRPLAWVSIVMGIATLTPAGAVGFLLLPLWLIVLGVVLYRLHAAPATEARLGDLRHATSP